MRCVLTDILPVERYAAFAELAWLERRPELGALCRAARAEGRRVTDAAVKATLPGVTAAGAKSIVAWCRTLGLCDAQGALTRIGDEAADTDDAPVPEQGVFDFWVVAHPLFGTRALHAERLAPSRDGRFDLIAPLKVVPPREATTRSVVDPDARFVLRATTPTGAVPAGQPRETEARCRVRWTLDFDVGREQWMLDGSIDGDGRTARQFRHQPEQTGVDLDAVIALWGDGPLAAFGRWEHASRRLTVGFDSLTEREQEEFTKDLTLTEVEVSGRGRWKGVTLEKVPLGPATAEDASRWADTRLDRHLRTKPQYRTRSEVRALYAEVVEGTALEARQPSLCSHDELLQRYANAPEVFWSLAAPVDLAPRPVDEALLGPLQAGTTAATVPAGAPDAFRVPYRCGWSMRQLVERLLSGTLPQRALLCDRYVRGADNLAMLKAFVDSLHAAVPSLALDVWTDVEPDTLRQIGAITGGRVRTYHEAFAKAPPHDCYVLLGTRGSVAFGWQMSNSPLDGRTAPGASPTADAPLRWRDMTAFGLVADQLPRPLGAWLTEAVR